jgi:hypothetical protein
VIVVAAPHVDRGRSVQRLAYVGRRSSPCPPLPRPHLVVLLAVKGCGRRAAACLVALEATVPGERAGRGWTDTHVRGYNVLDCRCVAGKAKLIQDCIKFLQDPRVTSSLEDHRIKYLQERMKLTDEEVEECFQGAYGHGTAMFEKAKTMKAEVEAEKK